MTENRPNWLRALQNGSMESESERNSLQSGASMNEPLSESLSDKPAINEFFESDFSDASLDRIIIKEKAEPSSQPIEDLRLQKGARLFREKRWDEALSELICVQTAGLNSDEKAELVYYLGLCYTKLERFEDAAPCLEQFVGSGGGGPMRVFQCRMTLAYIYIMTDRAARAESELERLQAGGYESVMLYNTLAYAAYAQKHYLGAVELYEKALDMDDDNTTALNSLGYILADTGLDKLKGLRLCRKAVDKNGENAAYLDSLGWACYKCGKMAEARDWLGKALDLMPQEKEIRNHYRLVSGEAG